MTNEDPLSRLQEAFSPSAPIMMEQLFCGRREQLQKTCDAVNERGQHFVLFGERGVGKTSLANIINTHLRNVLVAKVTCNRNENFRQVWEKALSKVRFVLEHDGIGFRPEKTGQPVQLDLFLPKTDTIDSLDILNVLDRVSSHLLFVFDEFDSMRGDTIRGAFADTIKALSDNAPYVTVGIVGIAQNVEELVGQHASLERCLKQIVMPRMSADELGEILAKGMELLEIGIDTRVRDGIVAVSSGFPHYTHLLGKYSAKNCIEAGGTVVSSHHLRAALDDAVDNANETIRSGYQKATIAAKTKSKFEDVIAACALAEPDEYGTFATRDIVEPYRQITGRQVKPQNLSYNIQRLCEPDRGAVLMKVGVQKNVRYRFVNPLMRVFVKLKVGQHDDADQLLLF